MTRSRLTTTWLVTRCALAWAAVSAWYGAGTGSIRPWSDVELYADYASRITAGATPYADVAIEYPAAALPLVVAPELLAALSGVAYLAAFVTLALALDLAGLVALRRLASRWGSDLGPWAWVVGVALLGPLALLRLDLLPVVAMLWAAERAAAGSWAWTGGLVTVGAAAKLWPAGMLPAAAVAAPRWRRVVLGTFVVGGGVLLATVGVLGPMVDAAVLRNLERGLQVESLWGAALLAADAAGLAAIEVEFAFGADQVAGPGVGVVGWVARTVPVVVVGLGAWLARSTDGREPDRQYVHAVEAATLVLVAFGSVLSAQFVLWALGAVAAVACTGSAASRRRVATVGLACVLTATEFPWLYEALKDAQPQAVGVVVVRNLLLVAAAADAIRDALRSPAA